MQRVSKMDLARKSCRLCLSETDFNVSLYGNYCRKTNMLDKILVCLRLPIEDEEYLNTICYRCADSIERYYDFINNIKKAQTKLGVSKERFDGEPRQNNMNDASNVQMNNRRHITSYVREQVYDAADYTFSFLEVPNNVAVKETKSSSPFFSYFSPANVSKDSLIHSDNEAHMWKTPGLQNPRCNMNNSEKSPKRAQPIIKFQSHKAKLHQRSRDLFESQSQDVEETDSRLDWKLTPDENIIKRIRNKCFGLSDII